LIHYNSTNDLNQAIVELHNIAVMVEQHLGKDHDVCKNIRHAANLLLEELHPQSTEKGIQ
jgi:uncharacterized protein (UPF0147 family)